MLLRKLSLTIAMTAVVVSPMLASTFTSANATYAANTGTQQFFNVGAFDTSFGTQAGDTQMTGLQMTVTYVGGTTDTCTWATTAAGTGHCVSAGNFTVTGTDGANGTYNGTWSLTNNSALNISSVTFFGAGTGNTAGGLTGFDLCGTYTGTYPTGSFAPNFAPAGGFCGSNGTGTPNASYGYTASTPRAAGAPTGTASLQPSTVTYSNAIIDMGTTPVSGHNPVGDEFAQVNFGFCTSGAGCTAFAHNSVLTWQMDTDSLIGTPEPATLGLVGMSLLGLAAFHRRKKNS